MKSTRLLLVGTLALSLPASAQDRPAEDAMFGTPELETPPPTSPPPTKTHKAGPRKAEPAAPAPIEKPATDTGDARDSLNLGDPSAATRFSAEVAPEDPLKIGGQWYWRAASSARQDQSMKDWTLSAPSLLDMYLDARPNERVRAFAKGRMQYDPTLPPNGSTQSVSLASTSGASQGLDSLAQGKGTRGPSMYLDQLWLSFDVKHTAFVTAGKQHVRWGTGQIWAPTDFLHAQARNPLSPFDARTGTTMLKVHFPWEAQGWNFYAYALPENTDATGKVSQVAGAGRAEIVLGSMETGLGILARRGSKAKFAADVSFGVWDLDFHGEIAVRHSGDVDMVHYTDQPVFTPSCPTTTDAWSTYIPALVSAYFPKDESKTAAWKAQALGGVSYTRQYADKDTFTVGIEYFYNGLGYDTPKDYLGLLLPRADALRNPAQFFYFGRQYVGAFALIPAPYSWDNTSFTVSSLANLSDWSGMTRLDYSLTLLTHLRFEAYVGIHYGQRNGEFRMGFDTSSVLGASCIPPGSGTSTSIGPSLLDLGVGLRVAL